MEESRHIQQSAAVHIRRTQCRDDLLRLSSTCVCAFGYAPLVSDVRPCPKVLSAQLSRWLCPASPARALGPAGDAAGASARPMRFIRRMRLT